MEKKIVTTYIASEPAGAARRALVASGLWLRVGFIGASAFAAGLLQLVEGDAPPVSALALAVGGCALAAASWWRGRVVLDVADRASGPALMTSARVGPGVVAGR